MKLLKELLQDIKNEYNEGLTELSILLLLYMVGTVAVTFLGLGLAGLL